MKKTLLVLCLLTASAAFGQYYAPIGHLDSTPVVFQSPSHPEHASYAPVLGSNYSTAQGERPASDFPQPEGISLGAYAREAKKQHEKVKKARAVWVNQ